MASSMNKSMEKETHPAFVEIIKQLSADEVPILNLYIKHSLNAAIVNITSKSENGGVRTLYRNLLNLYKGDEVHVDSKISSYVDNWIRLGLVGVNYEKSLRGDDVYNSFIERPDFKLRKKRKIREGL
uniref:Abi-alpha family protein n=1 Tax=Serratia marcescens TaxID=615 RepID=UPI002852E67C|nr:Abi-alpha family protein [Serratia marcescens]